MGKYDQQIAKWSVKEIRIRTILVGKVIKAATDELIELRKERDTLNRVEAPTETQSDQLALIMERISFLVNEGVPEATRQAEELNAIRIAKNQAIREEKGFSKPPDQVIGLRAARVQGRALGHGSPNGKLKAPFFQKIPIDSAVLHSRHSELSIREVAELSDDYAHTFEFVLVCATCGFNNVVSGYPDVIVDCCDETCDSVGSYIRAGKLITRNKEQTDG